MACLDAVGQSVFPKLLPEKNGGSESRCLRDEVIVTTHVINQLWL